MNILTISFAKIAALILSFSFTCLAREPMKYSGSREPKHMISWLNKHCGTDFSADDWKPPRKNLPLVGKYVYVLAAIPCTLSSVSHKCK